MIKGEPSGKWLQRVPKSLHVRLIQIAEREGTSLNQWVVMAIAERVGRYEYEKRLRRDDAGDPTGLS